MSKKRIDLAVATALAEFNMDALHAQKAKMSARAEKVSNIAETIAMQRDARRKRKGKWKATTESKKARRARIIEKTALETAKKQVGGMTYTPGGF